MTSDLIMLARLAGGTLALVAIVLTIWSIRGDRARGRRRCPACWYDMALVPGITCPECGKSARRERRLFRTRRRWRVLMFSIMLLLLGAATWLSPLAWSGAWIHYTPPVVLRIATYPFSSEADARFKAAWPVPLSGAAPVPSFPFSSPATAPPYSLPPGMTTWDKLVLARACRAQILPLRRISEQLPAPLGALPADPADASDVARGLHAMDVLGQLGPPARVAFDVIDDMLRGDRPWQQQQALAVVQSLGPSARYFRDSLARLALHAPDDELRADALRTLAVVFPSAPRSVGDVFCGALSQDASPRIRAIALHLGVAHAKTHAGIRRHLENLALKAGADADRLEAFSMLASMHRLSVRVEPDVPMGPATRDPAAIRPLAERMLGDPSESMRIAAANCLRGLRADAAESLPALLNAWAHEPPSTTRFYFISAINAILPTDQSTGYLIAELEASPPHFATCAWALRELGRRSNQAPSIAPAVERFIEQHPWARARGLRALAAFGDPPSPTLVKSLRSSIDQDRIDAFEAVASAGTAAPSLIPILLAGLADAPEAIRLAAARALARYPRHAKLVHAEVVAAYQREPARLVRYELFNVFGRYERDEPYEYRGGLLAALSDPEWHLRARAATELARIGPAAVYACDELRRLLTDPVTDVQIAAREALKILDPRRGESDSPTPPRSAPRTLGSGNPGSPR
ncbi:MAG: HEAT repeat domain-containing protein [Phycisphaerales bacterium]